jgi:hypothetical protein
VQSLGSLSFVGRPSTSVSWSTWKDVWHDCPIYYGAARVVSLDTDTPVFCRMEEVLILITILTRKMRLPCHVSALFLDLVYLSINYLYPSHSDISQNTTPIQPPECFQSLLHQSLTLWPIFTHNILECIKLPNPSTQLLVHPCDQALQRHVLRRGFLIQSSL